MSLKDCTFTDWLCGGNTLLDQDGFEVDGGDPGLPKIVSEDRDHYHGL